MCPNCNTAFKSEDVVIVHAENDDLKLMQSRLEARLLEDAQKKLEKNRKRSSKNSSDQLPTSNKKLKAGDYGESKKSESELNTVEMKQSDSFKSLFHSKEGRQKLDPNRGFWSETTHSYFFKGT